MARLIELWMIPRGRRLRWYRLMVSSPAVFYSGYREEPRSRSGRSFGTAKHRSTPLRGTPATINYLCCECCAATNPRRRSCTRVLHHEASEGGPGRRGAAPGIGIIARAPRAGDRANRANPIESCNRFARNNNHDWIPRGFGGRTFRSP